MQVYLLMRDFNEGYHYWSGKCFETLEEAQAQMKREYDDVCDEYKGAVSPVLGDRFATIDNYIDDYHWNWKITKEDTDNYEEF